MRSSMRFLYNPLKAAQAAAHIVKVHGGPINLLVLMKLLYLADRKALIDSGYSITGDAMVSMPHGPVLSMIYDCVQWNERPWRDYISERSNHMVDLEHQNPGNDEMSDYEIHVLEQIHQQYGQLGPWDIRRLTHELPEYEDPNGSSSPIEPASILRFAGKSDHDIEILTREAEKVYIVGQIINASPA